MGYGAWWDGGSGGYSDGFVSELCVFGSSVDGSVCLGVTLIASCLNSVSYKKSEALYMRETEMKMYNNLLRERK